MVAQSGNANYIYTHTHNQKTGVRAFSRSLTPRKSTWRESTC